MDVKLKHGMSAVQKREGLWPYGTYRYEVATHELISALENTRPSVGKAVLTLKKKHESIQWLSSWPNVICRCAYMV